MSIIMGGHYPITLAEIFFGGRICIEQVLLINVLEQLFPQTYCMLDATSHKFWVLLPAIRATEKFKDS